MEIAKDQKESVAAVLERFADRTIEDWSRRVLLHEGLMAIPISEKMRCQHLPQMFRDLVDRLGSPPPVNTAAAQSRSAIQYGTVRCVQGYSPSMMVE
jgi:hypothetical protein